jgi:hypothetical protein
MPKDKAPESDPELPPHMDDPEQSRRFIELARELECDDSDEAFERIFARVVRPPVPGQPSPPKAAPRKGTGRPGRTKSGG